MKLRVVAMIAMLGCAGLSAELDRQRHAAGLTRDRATTGSGSLAEVGVVALGGFRAFVLDVLWCRAVDQWMRKEWHLTAGTFEAIETLGSRMPEVYVASGWTTCYSIAGDALAAGDETAAWRWLRRGLAQLERGRAANPESARLAYVTSFIYFDKGKREPYWSRFRAEGVHPVLRSRELAREAVTLAPNNAGMRYWLALACRHAAGALEDLGRIDDARATVEQGRVALTATRRLLPAPDEDDPGLLYFHHRVRESERLLSGIDQRLAAKQRERKGKDKR